MQTRIDSLGNPSTKEKALTDRPRPEDKLLDKRKLDNLEDCLAFSTFFQKPKCQVLISVAIDTGTPRILAGLLYKGVVPNLAKSASRHPSWSSHVKHVKAFPLRTAIKHAVPVEGGISQHVYLKDAQKCIGNLHACAGLKIVKTLAVNLLLGTS